MANDAIDPTDSTFEDHWDKLEIKLNKRIKSSLLGFVTSIMLAKHLFLQLCEHQIGVGLTLLSCIFTPKWCKYDLHNL